MVESWNKNSVYYGRNFAVYYGDRWIHFGDSRYDDFTVHRDPVRRASYRKKAARITNARGEYAYRNKSYANFWAYHLLW